MFAKILVANRGEIAIRAFRAAYELGVGTVAVYPFEDRNSLHRLKADESYQIGEPGHPVRAYLSVDEVVATAVASGADAIYPGYGFLSENQQLASACAKRGITFVGPSAEVLALTGNKSRAIAAARSAGLPVLASTAPSASVDELVGAAESMTYPLFVKAVAGGGGRGHLDQLLLRDRDTGETELVPAAGLFILIGAQPFTDWLPEAIKRDPWGFILTGPDTGQDWPLQRPPFLLETTTPGVFAVGDVRHGSMKRVAAAVGDGSTAIRLIHDYLALAPSGR